MVMRLLLFIVNLVLLIMSFTAAQESIVLSETRPPKDSDARPEYLDISHLTILRFTVGKHTLCDVMNKLGSPEIVKDGQFHHSRSICFISSKQKDKTKLIFIKNPLADLLGFCLTLKDKDFIENNKCIQSDSVSELISTESGLHLGMSKKELIEIFGSPTDSLENLLTYRYHIQEKMDEETVKYYIEKAKRYHSIPTITHEKLYWDVMSTLEAEFSNLGLCGLTILKTVTY